jgi:antiviral helicase SKI2
MNAAIEFMRHVVNEWVRQGSIREVEYSKLRDMKVQEAVQKREALLPLLKDRSCTQCPSFHSHVRIVDPELGIPLMFYFQYKLVHTIKTLETRIQALKFFISDQNLELLPDYEQRIEVLKELQFITETGTVSLKGRVACEVSCTIGSGESAECIRSTPPTNSSSRS